MIDNQRSISVTQSQHFENGVRASVGMDEDTIVKVGVHQFKAAMTRGVVNASDEGIIWNR